MGTLVGPESRLRPRLPGIHRVTGEFGERSGEFGEQLKRVYLGLLRFSRGVWRAY